MFCCIFGGGKSINRRKSKELHKWTGFYLILSWSANIKYQWTRVFFFSIAPCILLSSSMWSFHCSFQIELKKPSIGKEYFHHMNLEAIVTNYPYRKNLPLEDMKKGSSYIRRIWFYETILLNMLLSFLEAANCCC